MINIEIYHSNIALETIPTILTLKTLVISVKFHFHFRNFGLDSEQTHEQFI